MSISSDAVKYNEQDIQQQVMRQLESQGYPTGSMNASDIKVNVKPASEGIKIRNMDGSLVKDPNIIQAAEQEAGISGASVRQVDNNNNGLYEQQSQQYGNNEQNYYAPQQPQTQRSTIDNAITQNAREDYGNVAGGQQAAADSMYGQIQNNNGNNKQYQNDMGLNKRQNQQPYQVERKTNYQQMSTGQKAEHEAKKCCNIM